MKKENSKQKVKQTRVARICWNTNSWESPSGMPGKSLNKKTFENINGYGHEEWLFEKGREINGYHYGKIEAISQHNKDKFKNYIFDLYLFSINSITKERFWVGKIKNVEVISDFECNKIYEEYIKRDWKSFMKKQLENFKTSALDRFDSFDPVDISNFFTIKFKEEDVEVYDLKTHRFSKNDTAIPGARYRVLYNFKGIPKFI